MQFLLLGLALPILASAQQICGTRGAAPCEYGFTCVEKNPGDFATDRGGRCQRPTCGGFAGAKCPTGLSCKYPTGSSLGTCYPITCGGFAGAKCPDNLDCRYLDHADYGYCYPKPSTSSVPAPKPTLPTPPTGETCGGFAINPKTCPTGQVCVDKIDPTVISDMPGVCVTRVDCGGKLGNTCPKLWKCSASGIDTGYCVYDFAAAKAASSAAAQPTPVPTTLRKMYQ